MLRALAGVVAVILVAVGAVYWYERPMLLTGTGYAAHHACAVTSVAGRSDPATDLPDNPLVPYLRTRQSEGHTRATLFGVLAGQSAWYTPVSAAPWQPTGPTWAQPPPSPPG